MLLAGICSDGALGKYSPWAFCRSFRGSLCRPKLRTVSCYGNAATNRKAALTRRKYLLPWCVLQDYYGGAYGGAIFNKGDIIVDGEASFTGNTGGVRANLCVSSLRTFLNEASQEIVCGGVGQPKVWSLEQTLPNAST